MVGKIQRLRGILSGRKKEERDVEYSRQGFDVVSWYIDQMVNFLVKLANLGESPIEKADKIHEWCIEIEIGSIWLGLG